MQRYEQSGIIWGTQLNTALDEKTCPICECLDNEIVQLKEYFKITYKNKQYQTIHPPLHIYCRCRVVPITFIQAKKMGLYNEKDNDN